MTLPDPHGCPHCGHDRLAERWGETICGMCGAPRQHAEPGCPVRNAMEAARTWVTLDELRESIAEEARLLKESRRENASVAEAVARERRVHDGGPRGVE